MKKYLVWLGLALALAGVCAPVAAQTTDTGEWYRWFTLTNAIRQQARAIQNLQTPIYYPYVWGPPGYPSGGLGALFLLNRVNYERRMMEEYARRSREIEDYYARQRRETRDYWDAYLNVFLTLSPEDRTVFSLLPPDSRSTWLSLSPEDREDYRHDGTLARALEKAEPEIVDAWKAIAGVPPTASSSDAAKALRMKLGRDRYGRVIHALIEGNTEAIIFEFAVFYKAIEEKHQRLKLKIESMKAEFPNARESDVWKLLELQDEMGGPLYDVRSAMKKSHEDQTAFLKRIPEKK